jgi:hypothetical protein
MNGFGNRTRVFSLLPWSLVLSTVAPAFAGAGGSLASLGGTPAVAATIGAMW